MKVLKRVYADIFKWVPGSAVFSVMRRAYDGLTPVLVTLVSVGLFDSAADVINSEGDFKKLSIYAGLYLLIYLVNDLLGFATSIIVQCWVYEKCTSLFRLRLIEKFAKLPLIALEDANVLNRKQRVDRAVDNEELSSAFQRSQAILQNAVSVIGVAIVLARYSIWLMPLSFVSVMPYLFARVVRGKEFYYVKRVQAKKSRLQNYLWDLFTTRQAAKEMRVMGFGDYITRKWQATRDDVNEELWAVEKKDALSLMLCDGVRIVGYCASIGVVLYLVINSQITLGVFGGAITAFLSMQNATKELLSEIGRLTEHITHARDYYAFLDMPIGRDGDKIYTGLRERVTLENVSFSYPNAARPALESVNLDIRKGEIIAVLGENGSGKTTLSKLLMGIYPPAAGRVLYDGTPIEEFNLDSLYSQISAVTQDFVAYSLTKRENVAISDIARLGDDTAIQKALNDAGVRDASGIDDMLGREFGGAELSVGQWQKLAIARGIFKNAELMVLDEPTSALDPLIETEILSEFIKAAAGKTAIIISHSVGLCKLVDRIIVMKHGEITEQGAHDELISKNGEYTRLYNAQAKWYV